MRTIFRKFKRRTELKWDPSVTHEKINVMVESAVVTLLGSVPTFEEKKSAEAAVQRVAGVKAIVEGLEILSTAKACVRCKNDNIDLLFELLALPRLNRAKCVLKTLLGCIHITPSRSDLLLGGFIGETPQ